MRKSVLIIIMIFLVFMIGFDLSHRTWKSMSKINGNFQCFPDTRIYLAALSVGGTSILDSTLAGPTGNFEFNIRNLKKDIFFLQVSRNNFIPVILKPGDYLSVSSKELSLRKDYKLSGSDESEEIRNFEQMLRRSEIEIDSTNDLVFR